MNQRHITYKCNKREHSMLGSRMQSSKVTKAFEIEIVNNKINIVTSYFKRCLEALRK